MTIDSILLVLILCVLGADIAMSFIKIFGGLRARVTLVIIEISLLIRANVAPVFIEIFVLLGAHVALAIVEVFAVLRAFVAGTVFPFVFAIFWTEAFLSNRVPFFRVGTVMAMFFLVDVVGTQALTLISYFTPNIVMRTYALFA